MRFSTSKLLFGLKSALPGRVPPVTYCLSINVSFPNIFPPEADKCRTQKTILGISGIMPVAMFYRPPRSWKKFPIYGQTLFIIPWTLATRPAGLASDGRHCTVPCRSSKPFSTMNHDSIRGRGRLAFIGLELHVRIIVSTMEFYILKQIRASLPCSSSCLSAPWGAGRFQNKRDGQDCLSTVVGRGFGLEEWPVVRPAM